MQKLRLLDQAREVCRVRHYSPRADPPYYFVESKTNHCIISACWLFVLTSLPD